MNIEAITGAGPLTEIDKHSTAVSPQKQVTESPFMEAVNQLNNSVTQADELVQKFVLDGNVDVQEVMMAMEQARMMMDLAVQVRNKTVEAAQQLLRMQI